MSTGQCWWNGRYGWRKKNRKNEEIYSNIKFGWKSFWTLQIRMSKGSSGAASTPTILVSFVQEFYVATPLGIIEGLGTEFRYSSEPDCGQLRICVVPDRQFPCKRPSVLEFDHQHFLHHAFKFWPSDGVMLSTNVVLGVNHCTTSSWDKTTPGVEKPIFGHFDSRKNTTIGHSLVNFWWYFEASVRRIQHRLVFWTMVSCKPVHHYTVQPDL